ncbi:F-box domain, Leucine-rich repeat domain, L domain-like protein [Artemisia annua]|uniref:F-box domain, Leucine-rich repeat domain, L domain-like protein n=1 Tax=Artemisia annua TaxID=35608 RepID=A0A2U1NEV1_ARTAN|nr:F-box domain, Leucine-rich repeat domain, L domain-like protein [Artemisia annua]
MASEIEIWREIEDNITDRISELPGFIIHHILSYLDSPKELVRMSVLSNYWFELTASFPISDFSFHKFKEVIRSSGIPIDTEKEKLDIFFKYVEYTVSRFCEQNVSANTFKLIISFPGPNEVGIIDRCLGLILEKGVRVLVIDVSYVPQLRQMYRVPNILLSASSLTSMKLRKCELPSSLMVDVRLKSLKILHMISIPLNEEMITRLTTSCPFLEEYVNKKKERVCFVGTSSRICLEWFLGIIHEPISYPSPTHTPSFSMGILHQTLAQYVARQTNVAQHFTPQMHYSLPRPCQGVLGPAPAIYASQPTPLPSDRDERGSPPFLNLTACKKLTKLHYYGQRLTHLASNFPFLEDLFLLLPDECKSFNVSKYLGWFFPIEKSEVPSKARLEYDCHDFVGDLWFKKLRQFLVKNVGFKEPKLRINVVNLLFTELKLIQWPPLELEKRGA